MQDWRSRFDPRTDPIDGFMVNGHEPLTYGCVRDVVHDARGDLTYERDRVHPECQTAACPCNCRACAGSAR